MMQVVRRAAGRKIAGISRTTEHRLLHEDPTWPRPIQITAGGLTGYIVAEVEEWVRALPRVEFGETEASCGEPQQGSPP